MKKTLVLLGRKIDANGKIIGFLRFDNYNVVNTSCAEKVSSVSTPIVYNREQSGITMKHRGLFPKANAILLEERVSSNLYTASYWKVR